MLELKDVEFDEIPVDGEVRECGLGKDVITNVRTIKKKDPITEKERDVFIADVERYVTKEEYVNEQRFKALTLIL